MTFGWTCVSLPDDTDLESSYAAHSERRSWLEKNVGRQGAAWRLELAWETWNYWFKDPQKAELFKTRWA